MPNVINWLKEWPILIGDYSNYSVGTILIILVGDYSILMYLSGFIPTVS